MLWSRKTHATLRESITMRGYGPCHTMPDFSQTHCHSLTWVGGGGVTETVRDEFPTPAATETGPQAFGTPAPA